MELTEEPLARIRKYLPRSRGNVQRDESDGMERDAS